MLTRRTGGRTRKHLALVLAGCALTSCALADPVSRESVTVSALWHGTAPDGSLAYGTTPVDITTWRQPFDDGEFAVDLRSFDEAGAGATWEASAWTAAAVAMLSSASDPRGQRVAYGLGESIDGPSASGLLSVGVLADLSGKRLDDESSMTGMVLPNGSIGAVSGIPDKLRAAHEAGLRTVLIPDGAAREVDPVSGRTVDLRRFGESLGVDVVPVATIEEASAILGRRPLPPVTYRSPDVDESLVELLTEQTRSAAGRVRRQIGDLAAPARAAGARERTRIAAAAASTLRSVPRLLARSDVFAAFAQITLVESDIGEYEAAQQALRRIRAIGLERARTRLALRAKGLAAVAARAVSTQAGRVLQFLEQYPAMADALTWGTGTQAIVEQAADGIGARGSSAAALSAAAADLARADYRLRVYLPVQIRAVLLIGRVPALDPPQSLSLLASYAALLGQTADAVMAYHDSLQAGVPVAPSLRVRAQRQRELWQQRPQGQQEQGDVLHALALSLSYYIAAANLFTIGPLLDSFDSPGAPVLLDEGYFADQVNIATTQNHSISATVEGLGLDPSYVVWGNEWGLALADQGAGVSVPDTVRARGLTYQWYASVQGRILAAAAPTTRLP